MEDDDNAPDEKTATSPGSTNQQMEHHKPKNYRKAENNGVEGATKKCCCYVN
jgi:hypothetical protein